jgi:hypothetical protein
MRGFIEILPVPTARQIGLRSGGKDYRVVWSDLSPGALIPLSVNEVRPPPHLHSAPEFFAAEPDEVEGWGVTLFAV